MTNHPTTGARLRIVTDGLSPMQLGRLNKALDTVSRYNGVAMTLRAHLATLNGEKRESDGMADYSRTRFNRMNDDQQAAYMARLKARRVFLIDGWIVPKIVFDAVAVAETFEPGDVLLSEAEAADLFGEAKPGTDPYEADGADARAHGYGLDRNPYTWDHAQRGPETAANAAKREAWARGWAMATPIGTRGIYRTDDGTPLIVTTLARPERYAGKSASDATPWVGVSVAFEGVAGRGFVPALAIDATGCA